MSDDAEELEAQERRDLALRAEEDLIAQLETSEAISLWDRIRTSLHAESFWQSRTGHGVRVGLIEKIVVAMNEWMALPDPLCERARQLHSEANASFNALGILDALVRDSKTATEDLERIQADRGA